MAKRVTALFISFCMLLTCFGALGVFASEDSLTVSGVAGSGLPGGNFERLAELQFKDLFEEDGSNGTNGTIAFTDGGLVAETTEDALLFKSKSTQTSGPARGAQILDVTYPLPTQEMTEDKQYYLLFPFSANPQGGMTVSFEDADGTAVFAMAIDYSSTTTIKLMSASTQIGTTSYTLASETTPNQTEIGLLLNPVTKQFAVLADGDVVAETVQNYSAGSISNMHIVWSHSSSTGHWTMNVHNRLCLSTFTVYEETAVMTDAEKVAADKAALDLGDVSAVTEDLTLPTVGSVNGSTIVWKSDNTEVITISEGTAVVTRPQSGDVQVTLTATITNGTASDTKEFIVTVLEEQAEPGTGETENIVSLLAYDANAEEGGIGYVDVNRAADYGIKADTSVIWGLVKEEVLGRQSFRFSPRSINNTQDAKVYGSIVFEDDKVNQPSAFDEAETTYAVEMELSSLLRSQGEAEGHYYYTLMGTGADGNVPVVRIHMKGQGTEGVITVDGASDCKDFPVVLNAGTGDPVALYYLRVYIDMQAQSYSVAAVKRADRETPYSEVQPGNAAWIVTDQKFASDISALTGVEFSASNHYGGDKLNLSFLRIGKIETEPEPGITDAEKVAADKAALDLGDVSAVTENLTLPAVGGVNGSTIVWESNNTEVITISEGTAVVTRQQSGDVQVMLTATITNGTASDTKIFTVTVKGMEEEGGGQSLPNVNLALNKTVTAKDSAGADIPAYSATYGYEKMVDGDDSTRMAQNDWIDFSGSWIQVDLGAKYKFNKITLTEFAARLVRYKFQWSNDGSQWYDIGEEYTQNGAASPEKNVHEDYLFSEVEARYVRLYVEENHKLDASHYVGISIWEIGVYYIPTDLVYDPNAAEGEEGYMSSTVAADYGITTPSTSWSSTISTVNTQITSMAGKKGIMFSPRRDDTEGSESVLRETGRMVFANDTVNRPQPFDDTENGYLFELEFLSYLRPNKDGQALWQYRLMGRNAAGEEAVVAGLQTDITRTEGQLPEAENGINYGTASMINTQNSISVSFPSAGGFAAAAPHVSYLRVYVDLKNQTYTAWLVTRADVNTPYSEAEPEKADLLVKDEPFDQTISEITGVQVWSQNTSGDQSHFTKMSLTPLEDEMVVSEAGDALEMTDILGENTSAEEITSALSLPAVYQNASVAWTAEPALIAGDGSIISTPVENTAVTLTAVLTRGSVSKSKQFTVTVTPGAVPETDERKVEIETAGLTLGDISAVTDNLNLPVTGSLRGCDIQWQSSDAGIIEPNGTVHRPLRDTVVTLTAVVSFGSASQQKGFEVTVKGTQASREIEGIEGSYFSGGTFYRINDMNFKDYFEGDGSNGTNGTVPYTNADGVVGGLKASVRDDGIYFEANDKNTGANPGRGLQILDQTYTLPELENPSNPYYLELSFAMTVSGEATISFGQEGDNSVLEIVKNDGGQNNTQSFSYNFSDSPKETGTYVRNADTTIGLYVIPELKELVLYQNGQKLSDTIYSYSVPSAVLSTMNITWSQNTYWWTIPATDYFWIKDFNVYEGPEIPAEIRLGMDKDALTLSAITSEKAGEITRNLSLYEEGKFGSVITWTSSDPEVIDPATGAVTRQESDRNVTLTATLTNGDLTETVVFELTVQKKQLEDNLLLDKTVTISNGMSIEDLSNLTDGNYNTYIETMDPAKKPIITVDLGEVQAISTVVIYGMQGFTEAKLETSEDGSSWTEIEAFSVESEQKTLSFLPVMARYIRLTVTGAMAEQVVRISEMEAAMNASDADIVRADLSLLKAFESYNVNAGTTLAAKGVFGSDITWESSEPDIVSNSGAFTAPNENTPFTMTAYAVYGSADGSATFSHMALGKGSSSRPGGGSGGSGSSGGRGGSLSGTGSLVSVTGDTVQEPENPDDNVISDSVFPDVPADSWAYGYIKELKEANIVSGDEQGMFRPQEAVTREEFLKLLLGALDIEPDAEAVSDFVDVPADSWYAPYVNTAVKLGLVNGISETQFGTGQEITRQDMAVMTKRALDLAQIVLGSDPGVALNDIEQVAEYAKDSVLALAAAGIISGDENGNFEPNQSALREQAAKIIFMVMQMKEQ